ncbi:hypothetical protein ASG28_00715 [Frigoribacterium sp. Leaf415]|nr:hypothetical protein ASF07_00715 [Frigoribacterium sp. Leaf254]KQT38424.1 hypothetical protein ASG28_00715 [Frigoribacterium sp. Leaf415]
MFLGVDWGAFVVVFATALAATAVIVTSFALGIRLFADGAVESGAGAGAGAGPGAVASNTHPSRSRPLTATIAGGLCFAVGTAAVLFGLWMIVPQFH